LLAFALNAVAALNATAESSRHAETNESASNWHFSLGVGAGVRTNPVEYASDIPIVLLPQVEYSGERFFIQNLDLGFVISENKTHQLNLLLTPSYDQMFFDRWNSGNFFVEQGQSFGGSVASESDGQAIEPPGKASTKGFADNHEWSLHKRRITALGGIEYNFSSGEMDWQLQWVQDLLDVHQGNEVRAIVSKEWRFIRSSVKASVGLLWQDQNELNYYYGLNADETAVESVYRPDSDISTLVRLDWNYRLNENWDVRLFSSYRHLGDEITQSPLINDDKIVTVFFGGVYHF
jgi:MipA family protein